VVIGFVLYGIGSMIATAIFPRIAAEEAVDSISRMGVEPPSPQYDEDVNQLPSLPSPYDKLK